MYQKLLLTILAAGLGGALVGLAEASYLLSQAGTITDMVSVFYSSVLYMLIGQAMGVGVGIGVVFLEKLAKRELSAGLAWTLGFFGAAGPLALVIGMFLANKFVYAEAGVPMTGKLAILCFIGLDFAIGLAILPRLLNGPLKALAKPAGTFGLWAVIAVLAALCSFATGAGGEAPMNPEGDQPAELAQKPNVLFIVVDTLRADYTSVYAPDGPAKTPALESLAADALVFERGHANASWTRASFSNMYTSMVPSAHKTALKTSQLPDDVDTLAEALQDQGYNTGGYPNNTNVTATFGFGQGFDHFPYLAPAMPFWGTESVYQLSMYSVLRKVAEKAKGNHKEVSDFYQPSQVVIDRAKGFIQAQGDEKWFLMLHFMEPHDPYFERPYNGTGYGRAEHEVPEADKVDYLKQTYATEIEYMDKDIAGFFAWLKESGQYDDTVIVFTSDHGEEFLEHDGWWHGTTLYQEQIHVPFIVKLQGNANGGTRVPFNAAHIDLAPTVVGATGGTISDKWMGKDLVAHGVAPMMENAAAVAAAAEAAAATPDEAGDAAPPAPTVAPVDPRSFDLLVFAEEDFEGNQISAVIKGDFKYIAANEGNPRGLPTQALFNLGNDPVEQNNLAGQGLMAQDELTEEVQKQTLAATTGGVEAAETEMDDATRARLEALGYMGE